MKRIVLLALSTLLALVGFNAAQLGLTYARSQPVPVAAGAKLRPDTTPAPGTSPLCTPGRTKIRPDLPKLPDKSYWVFVVTVTATQNLNAIAAHANGLTPNLPFQACLLGYEPYLPNKVLTPAIERDITCEITGNVGVVAQKAVFTGGVIACPVNLQLTLKQPNVNISLATTYVYTNFAMLGVGALISQSVSVTQTANPFLYYESRPQDKYAYLPMITKGGTASSDAGRTEARRRSAKANTSPFDLGLFLPVFAGAGNIKEVNLRSMLNGTLTPCAPLFGGVLVGGEDTWTTSIINLAQFAERNHNQPGDMLINCNAQTPVNFATNGATIYIGGQPGGPNFTGLIDEVVIDPSGGTSGDGN